MNLWLILAAIPVALFAYLAWGRLVSEMRRDAKDAAALRLADEYPPFARALHRAQQYGAYLVTPELPWRRQA